MAMAQDWRTPDAEALFDAILRLEDREEAERFFRDLCTLNELHDMAQRWAVVRLLDGGLHYAEISRQTGASTATITRIASWLNHGEGGYRAMLDKLDAASRGGTDPYPTGGRAMRERLRLAIPNKGRMVEPTLRAAARRRARLRGARPEPRRARPELRPRHPVRAHERHHRVRRRRRRRPRASPASTCCRETGAELPRVRELGYGRCRLAAAVPNDTPVPGRRGPRRPARRDGPPQHRPPVLRGAGHPGRHHPDLRCRRGRAAARAWPRRIVDLVSTGSTLVMNGLRQIGDVLASEAVLVANPTADRERAAELAAIDTMLERGHRRPRPQVPDDERARDASSPSSRRSCPALESPTVIPLAHAGMIAIHSVVGADDVWGLLPRLKAAGRVRDPRPADREDRPVTSPSAPAALRLRRLDLAAVAAGDPAADRRTARPRPPRRRPRSRPSARRVRDDPRRRPRARRRRRP